MGSTGYTLADSVRYRPGDCILEIGSERGEGSTAHLGLVARERRVPFLTVDLRYGMSGEQFMRQDFGRIGLRIAFAYLDNFDWPYRFMEGTDYLADQAMFYRQHGLDLTCENSQQAHLEQAVEVAKFCRRGSLVVFDDTWRRRGGRFDGKGGLAVPWLLGHGFRLAEKPRTGVELPDSYVAVVR